MGHAQELVSVLPPSSGAILRDEWQLTGTARVAELFQLIDKDIINVVGFRSPEAIERMRSNAIQLGEVVTDVSHMLEAILKKDFGMIPKHTPLAGLEV